MCPTDTGREGTFSRVHGEGGDVKSTVSSLVREMERGQGLRLNEQRNRNSYLMAEGAMEDFKSGRIRMEEHPSHDAEEG